MTRAPLASRDGGSYRTAEAGFTLVEALVSLTIAAAAFAVVGTALTTVSRGWSTHIARDSVQDSLQRATALLRRDLRAMRLEDIGASSHWQATTRALSFIADASPREAVIGAMSIAYAIESRPEGDVLVRRSRELTDGATVRSDVVLAIPSRISFAYRTGEQGARWRPSWPDTLTRPSLVRLATAGGAVGSTEAIVALRPMASPACARATAPPCLRHPTARVVSATVDTEAVR